MDYTTLSLAEVRAGFEDLARQAEAKFGGLDARQLNWRPEAARWSVAQCFEHLVTANGLMLAAAKDALDQARPRTLWQRVPVVPGMLGRALIRSQAPSSTRKYAAASRAQPTASEIPADVLQRFVAQHHDLAAWVQRLDEREAARTIMVSPFISVVTYSVLDSCRLMVAHDWRHVEQADRVRLSPAFPA
jgi:DinB superfamily